MGGVFETYLANILNVRYFAIRRTRLIFTI